MLFLGNSRLQFAFSTSATADWFSAASARYYLLGFSYFENMIFVEPLLRKIRPRAKVYVINVDDFFDRTSFAASEDDFSRSHSTHSVLYGNVSGKVCMSGFAK